MAFAFLLQLAGGWFGIPRPLARWLVGAKDKPSGAFRYVVVLGGGGIPSESGLIRTYYAAKYGLGQTGVVFVVSLPADTGPETNSVGRMKQELILRGLAADSILMEYRGLNTHEQAAQIARLLGASALNEPVLLVTSPWHMRRSLLCFRKAGFCRVRGLAAYNEGAEADMGSGTMWRYGIWANLSAEVECARECVALLYYKLRGWI